MHLYCCYLRGCCLYRDEVDVIRFVVDSFYGGKLAPDRQQYALMTLQHGCRLWAAATRRTALQVINKISTSAKAARKMIKERYDAVPYASRTKLIEITRDVLRDSKTALFKQPEFWTDLIVDQNIRYHAEETFSEDKLALMLSGRMGIDQHTFTDDEKISLRQVHPDQVITPSALSRERVEFKTLHDLLQELQSRAHKQITLPILLYLDQRRPVPLAPIRLPTGAVQEWHQLKPPKVCSIFSLL